MNPLHQQILQLMATPSSYSAKVLQDLLPGQFSIEDIDAALVELGVAGQVDVESSGRLFTITQAGREVLDS